MITALDEHTALVLIDLQYGILGAALAHPKEDVLANCSKLVTAFRKAGLPIVIVNVDPKGPFTEIRTDRGRRNMEFKKEQLQIVPEIETQPNDIFITKHTWGAFYETSLNDELTKRVVTGIVIGGVSTSIGVEGTARQAAERGYNITFALDAMTDMVMEAHERSQKIIFPRIGETGTTDEVIAQLNNRA